MSSSIFISSAHDEAVSICRGELACAIAEYQRKLVEKIIPVRVMRQAASWCFYRNCEIAKNNRIEAAASMRTARMSGALMCAPPRLVYKAGLTRAEYRRRREMRRSMEIAGAGRAGYIVISNMSFSFQCRGYRHIHRHAQNREMAAPGDHIGAARGVI